MKRRLEKSAARLAVNTVGAFLLLMSGAVAPVDAQEMTLQTRPWTASVLRPTGQPVIPIFEGWYTAPDGGRRLCFGYFNLNTEESVDIPVGPDNRLEPASYNGMQPTHFDPVPESGYRRALCVFTLAVPDDFTMDDRIVWTIQSRGQTLSVPGGVMPPYVLDEPSSMGLGLVAPTLRFEGSGPAIKGRDGQTVGPLTVRVDEPLELTFAIEHPAARTWLGWSKHRGPGDVRFSQPEMRVAQADGKATTVAYFSAPGEYLLRAQSIDSVTNFEYHCCWTNAFVAVTVTR